MTPILTIENLAVSFPGRRKGQARLQAVDGISLSIYPRQTLAIVGESGSGKSVSAMSILQLIPTPPGRYDSGTIRWHPGSPPGSSQAGPEALRRSGSACGNNPDIDSDSTSGTSGASGASGGMDLLRLSDRQMRKVRGNHIAMIFQEPMTSLNPVYTIGEQILEAILLHQHVTSAQARRIAADALGDVGIADPVSRLKEYPHQLSGGMRQRVMIAMALACQPQLLLADEPTTALDVTIQAQILELLRSVQNNKDMAVLLITHDLGVVAENADVVAVMYGGRIAEIANVHELFKRPLHPYTRGLLKSMPVLGQRVHRLPTVTQGADIPKDFPDGYKVAPHVADPNPEGGYGGPDARLYEVEPSHWVLCTALAEDGHVKSDPPRPAVPRLPYRRAEVEVAAK